MILQEQKRIIIDTFGPKYAKPIVERLTKNKVYNADGKPFSPESIRMIVNGRPNVSAEKEIIKITIAEKQAQKELKNQLSA